MRPHLDMYIHYALKGNYMPLTKDISILFSCPCNKCLITVYTGLFVALYNISSKTPTLINIRALWVPNLSLKKEHSISNWSKSQTTVELILKSITNYTIVMMSFFQAPEQNREEALRLRETVFQVRLYNAFMLPLFLLWDTDFAVLS